MNILTSKKNPQELQEVYGQAAYASVVKDLKGQLGALRKKHGDTDEKYPELLKRMEQ